MARTKRKAQKENPRASAVELLVQQDSIGPPQKRLKTEGTKTERAPLPNPPKFTSQKKASGAPTKPLTKEQLLADKSPFPEEQDRMIEGPLYEYLGSETIDERLQAADVIISKLLDGDGVSERSLDRHLEKRLFRGLASSRKASRLGFSFVLTEILQQLWGEKNRCGDKYRGLTFEFVLNTFAEKTKPVGNIAGQEERDHYFGQLFGLDCFVRAKVLFDDVTRWYTILYLLLRLAKKKIWLKPECAWVIAQAVDQMNQAVAEETLRKCDESGWAKTSEAVALTIAFTERFPKIKLPSKSWRDYLSTKCLGELPAILKDSGKQEADKEESDQKQKQKQGQSNWTAQLHFVWDIILAHYTKLAIARPDDASNHFKQFWSRVVDQGFFSKTATETQKFTGFMIFHKFLENGLLHPHIVQNLFSQNFTTCLMNQAAIQDRYLHRAATKTLKVIERAAESNPGIVPVVVEFLLGKPGVYNFDQKTNSKTVDKLLHCTRPEHASQVLKTLRQLVLLANDEENPESHVLVFADYLFRLATVVSTDASAKSSANISVAGVAIEEFSKLAYPKTNTAPAGFSDKTKPILRQKLNAALARFVKRPQDFGEFCNAIMSIDSSTMDMDDELQAELIEALEKLQELTSPKKTKGNTSGAYQGLALLYAVAILQLYNEEPDAVDILNDLGQCYDQLSTKQKAFDTDTSALLVEILLAMVARPSQLMRQTAERVFEGFTALMTADALALLTDTLAAAESAEGLRALFDTDDMEDAQGVEDGNESDFDPDVEIVDLEDADEASEVSAGRSSRRRASKSMGSKIDDTLGSEDEQSSDNSEGSEEEDDEGNGDDDGEQTEQYKALNADLAKLLNSHPLDKDQDAASSDDDSDVSDSEMIKLDERITAAFKMRRKDASRKQNNRNAKETVVNFKHRALDLLAIFAKKEAANQLVLKLLTPLLQLMHTSKTRDLVKKAGNIIAELPKTQKKLRANKEGEQEPVQESDEVSGSQNELAALHTLLEEIHREAPKDGSHAYAKAASTASLLVVTAILTRDVGMYPKISDDYCGLSMQWAMYGGFQFSTLGQDWLNWVLSHPKLVAKRLPVMKVQKCEKKAGQPKEESDEESDDELDE